MTAYVGQCDVSGWNSIKEISAGGMYSVGLRSNGTVVVTGRSDYNYFGKRDAEAWTNIASVKAGYEHILGLKTDGTVVLAGDVYGKVSDWIIK